MRDPLKEVVEKLTNTELTFGCRVLYKKKRHRVLGSKGCAVCIMTENGSKWVSTELVKVLGHPIMKYDVEKVMIERGVAYRNLLSYESGLNALTDAWDPFGLDRPLQKILANAEWTKVCDYGAHLDYWKDDLDFPGCQCCGDGYAPRDKKLYKLLRVIFVVMDEMNEYADPIEYPDTPS